MSKKNVIEDDLAWVTASNWTCLIFKALIKDMEMKIIQKLYSHNRERRLLTFYVQFWFYKEGIIIVIFPERRWHIDGQWTVQRCGFDWVSKIDFLRQSRLYWTHLLRFPKIYELHDINNYILILGFCCYVSELDHLRPSFDIIQCFWCLLNSMTKAKPFLATRDHSHHMRRTRNINYINSKKLLWFPVTQTIL